MPALILARIFMTLGFILLTTATAQKTIFESNWVAVDCLHSGIQRIERIVALARSLAMHELRYDFQD
jgi:hypothetical protein